MAGNPSPLLPCPVKGWEFGPDNDCTSCDEQAGGAVGVHRGECPNSRRSCGHHCNHSWGQAICCWCGEEFGESHGDDKASGDAVTDQPTRFDPKITAMQRLTDWAQKMKSERDAALAEIDRLDQERGQACYDRDSARSVVRAWEQEVGRLTRELEAMRETLHRQSNDANDKILKLEAENLRLKRLLSPVEEG